MFMHTRGHTHHTSFLLSLIDIQKLDKQYDYGYSFSYLVPDRKVGFFSRETLWHLRR